MCLIFFYQRAFDSTTFYLLCFFRKTMATISQVMANKGRNKITHNILEHWYNEEIATLNMQVFKIFLLNNGMTFKVISFNHNVVHSTLHIFSVLGVGHLPCVKYMSILQDRPHMHMEGNFEMKFIAMCINKLIAWNSPHSGCFTLKWNAYEQELFTHTNC